MYRRAWAPILESAVTTGTQCNEPGVGRRGVAHLVAHSGPLPGRAIRFRLYLGQRGYLFTSTVQVAFVTLLSPSTSGPLRPTP
jgi:hypothetical protein